MTKLTQLFKHIAATSLLCLMSANSAFAQINELPRTTPESEGIPSKVVYSLFDSLMALPKTEIHSVMIARHGNVVAEMYPTPIKPEYRHTMYSCSKTFVGAAVGLAIADNKLRLDDRVALFFPEALPSEVSPELADMTVRHLLTMTSGVTPDWNMRNITPDWLPTYLGKKVDGQGKKFQYDSMCTYLLSAIVQKVTGMRLIDYLQEKIFNDMNITDVAWEVSPEGYNTGGWGLHIQPESLAKFGQLLIDNGSWHGKQLIPADWVKEMTSAKINDYCYQTWISEYPGSFAADGALGQYILMVPKKDLVVVITECTMINGRRQRGLVYDILLPAISDKKLTEGKDLKTLRKKETNYTLSTPKGKSNSKIAKKISGCTFNLEPNKLNWTSISLTMQKNQITAKVMFTDGKHFELPCGYKKWNTTVTDAMPPYSVEAIGRFTGIKRSFDIAGSYAWTSTNELAMRIQYANWVTALNLNLSFEDEELIIKAKENYSNDDFSIIGHADK